MGVQKAGTVNDFDPRVGVTQLLVAVLAGLIGGGTLPTLVPSAVRPDPFTGAMAKEMEERLLEEVGKEIEYLEIRLRASLPPENTRKRIVALEIALDELRDRLEMPSYQPPTTRFGALGALGGGMGGGGGGE